MFQSKIHPLVVPQHEHSRMAGTLAALWGNTSFDGPPILLDSFVKGVTFHDRGYGTFDNLRSIPEPSTLALLLMGAVGVLAVGWLRRNRAA